MLSFCPLTLYSVLLYAAICHRQTSLLSLPNTTENVGRYLSLHRYCGFDRSFRASDVLRVDMSRLRTVAFHSATTDALIHSRHLMNIVSSATDLSSLLFLLKRKKFEADPLRSHFSIFFLGKKTTISSLNAYDRSNNTFDWNLSILILWLTWNATKLLFYFLQCAQIQVLFLISSTNSHTSQFCDHLNYSLVWVPYVARRIMLRYRSDLRVSLSSILSLSMSFLLAHILVSSFRNVVPCHVLLRFRLTTVVLLQNLFPNIFLLDVSLSVITFVIIFIHGIWSIFPHLFENPTPHFFSDTPFFLDFCIFSSASSRTFASPNLIPILSCKIALIVLFSFMHFACSTRFFSCNALSNSFFFVTPMNKWWFFFCLFFFWHCIASLKHISVCFSCL